MCLVCTGSTCFVEGSWLWCQEVLDESEPQELQRHRENQTPGCDGWLAAFALGEGCTLFPGFLRVLLRAVPTDLGQHLCTQLEAPRL